jgi:hypothetical protein
MFLSLQEKTITEINTVRLLIDAHARLASNSTTEVRNSIKAYAVSSCVTRLYAIFESLIEEAISDYLDHLTELVRFPSLPDTLKTEYRLGISYILGKIDQGRYKHLSHENIVKWYYDALNDKENYRLVNDALIRHEQNLRLTIIENLFTRIHLGDFKSWLSEHPDIKNLYPDGNSFYDQLETELKVFIQLRNDASHGSIDNLEGEDNLIRLCEMVSAIISATVSFLTKTLLSLMEIKGSAMQLGSVTESFGQNGAFVTKVCKGTEISTGEKLYFISNNNCYSQTVKTMKINDKSINKVVAEVDDFEVGIRCNNRVNKHTKIYRRA